MTNLSGEELDRKIAKIAGLMEGRDFWGPQEHDMERQDKWMHTRYICKRCGLGSPDGKTGLRCYKPAPAYHESLDLIVPVVRKFCEDEKLMKQFGWAVGKRLYANADDYGEESLKLFLHDVDNPARLLCEALVEAVGGEECIN